MHRIHSLSLTHTHTCIVLILLLRTMWILMEIVDAILAPHCLCNNTTTFLTSRTSSVI